MEQVPADGVCAGVVALHVQFLAQPQHQLDGRRWRRVRGGMWPTGPGLERSLALDLVAGQESADPALRDVVGAGDLTLRGAG
jgi:hypothetical protein